MRKLDIACFNIWFVVQGKDFLPSWENCSSVHPDGKPKHRLCLSTIDGNGEDVASLLKNNLSLLKNKISVSMRRYISQYYQVSSRSNLYAYIYVTIMILLSWGK